MRSREQIVVEHGHLIDESAPVAKRIALYRALAGTSSSPMIAGHFFECADRLEAAEKEIGQLTLRIDQPLPVAPAVFLGTQEGCGDIPGCDLWKLTSPLPGHPLHSTVSSDTLQRHGFRLPERTKV